MLTPTEALALCASLLACNLTIAALAVRSLYRTYRDAAQYYNRLERITR